MSQITTLDFMPEGSPVVQIIPTAEPEQVLAEACKRLHMLADSLVIMGENQTLLNVAPEYSSLFMSWAQVAHEAGVMVMFVKNSDLRKIANSKEPSGFQGDRKGEKHA